MMALGDAETGRQILNIHRRSVRAAMKEIEADMMTQTRVNGRKIYARAEGILYARFDHFTSRPVTGIEHEKDSKEKHYTPDPNLHSHCQVLNVCKFNNRLQAIEASTIHRTANYYEELYHSTLSKGLQDIGFEIRRDRKRYEIYSPGMTRRTLEKFSRRTLLIEKEAKKRGITSAKRKAKLGAFTRQSKSRANADLNLKDYWWSKLTSREQEAIKTAKGTPRPSPNVMTATMAIDKALEHHLERRSVGATKIILAHAMKLGYGKLAIKDLKAELSKRDNIIYGSKSYVQYLTTRARVRQEDMMLRFAAQTKNTLPPLHPDYRIRQDFLNDQQRSAVRHILSSTNQVTILSGGAGTGKTVLLKEIKSACMERGKTIFAFAQSATASRDVLRKNGFEHADTIAAFLNNKTLQNQTKGQTLLIDEAGQLGVRDMSQIFKIARAQKCRVILSGDIRQHSSPAYGDACRLLIQKSHLPVARIEEIQRQKPNPEYKAAIKAMAKGRVRSGFDRLDKMGAIIEIEDVKARHKALADAYIQSLEAGRSAMVIAPTHAEGQSLNETIRAQMKTRQRIQGQGKTYIIQKPLSLTNAQKQDMAHYEPGMVVQFFQNAKGEFRGGFKAGQKYEVIKSDKNDEPLLRLPGAN